MRIAREFINTCTMSHRSHCNPAAERNKEPILQILNNYLPRYVDEAKRQGGRTLRCLEISSGSGQHVALFAKHFPSITFQPSEYDRSMFDSINAYIFNEETQNVCPPVYIDIRDSYKSWSTPEAVEASSIDVVININMMHISPFPCAEGLFANAGAILRASGLLFTYGPYRFHGRISPESNVRFDAGLRSQNPEWGLRDVDELLELGSKAGLRLVDTVSMPANNHILVWKKE